MASIKISIRRKAITGNFTDTFLEAFPPPSKKIKVPRSVGVLTACNQKLFIGVQMLLSSLCHSYDVQVLCLDTGMTEDQIKWCQRQPGVTVWKYENNLKVGDHIKYVGAWLKPFYMNVSPFRHTIWMDSDMMVQGDFMELVELSSPGAFFTSDWSNLKETTINHPMLYQHLTVPYNPIDTVPFLNTGLYILNKKRDKDIIEAWQYCVLQAFENKHIAETIMCWDQGAAKWALHKTEKLYLISPDKKFNYPAKVRHYSYPALSALVPAWMQSVREPCVVLHWMGGPKPWDKWGDMLDLDLTTKLK